MGLLQVLQQAHFLYCCGDGLHMSADCVDLSGKISAELVLNAPENLLTKVRAINPAV